MLLYIAPLHIFTFPNSSQDYSRRGPGAYDALASGKLPSSFRGLPVFTSYPLDTDFNGVSAQISFTTLHLLHLSNNTHSPVLPFTGTHLPA